MFTSPRPQLTYCLGFVPDVITDEIVETAKNRAHVLRDTRELFSSFVVFFYNLPTFVANVLQTRRYSLAWSLPSPYLYRGNLIIFDNNNSNSNNNKTDNFKKLTVALSEWRPIF